MENNCYETLEQKMRKELDLIQNKYIASPAAEMSMPDVEKADKLAHALKCLKTYNAMVEAEEYEEEGMSGRRGRAANGRYVSHDMSRERQSFENGYSQGYSDGQSGYRMPNWQGYPPRY